MKSMIFIKNANIFAAFMLLCLLFNSALNNQLKNTKKSYINDIKKKNNIKIINDLKSIDLS